MNIVELNNWKYEIEAKWLIAQKEIRRIRNTPLFNDCNKVINRYFENGQSERGLNLKETLDDETGLSKHYMTLQDLHMERLEWLAAYTNNNIVLIDKDNQQEYMILSHKLLHDEEGYDSKLLSKLMQNKAETA